MRNLLHNKLVLQCFFVPACALAVVTSTITLHRHQARANELARLRVATDRLYQEGCKQRDVLVASIEAYKQSLGCYPPDHVICQSPLMVDPVTNQLLYELSGTIYDPRKQTFAIPKLLSIPAHHVREYFGTTRFKNAAEQPENIQHFLDIANVTVSRINCRPERVGLVALLPTWEGMDPRLYSYFPIACWRYNSSSPTHNPASFDLWIEIETPETNILINNW